MVLRKQALFMTAFLCAASMSAFAATFVPRPQTNPVPTNIPVDAALDFSYTPDEPTIPDFPKPVDAHETDLQVLTDYYGAVSQSYESWGQKKMEEARLLQEKTMHETQGLVHNRLRSGTGGVSLKSNNAPLEKARMKAVSYYQSSYLDCQQQADLYLKKALIYQDLADMCADVMNTITKDQGVS